MFIAVLFTIAGKQVFINRSMHKQTAVRSYSGILSSNKQEQATDVYNKMMGLEKFMMNERSQTQKSTYCAIPLTCSRTGITKLCWKNIQPGCGVAVGKGGAGTTAERHDRTFWSDGNTY